ncbi:MAG: hypothetical protein KA101_00930 [Saprospiraceae bacterium]|nr:hypothetical protein [Saprospiraceae bacterium]
MSKSSATLPIDTIRQHIQLFLLLFMLILVLYFPTIGAGFVSDYLGLKFRFSGGSINNIPNKGLLNCFGFPALQHVLNLFLYTFHSIFKDNGLGWYIIYCLFHAINTYLVFKVMGDALQLLNIPDSRHITALAALIFMVSPYHTEVLVWKVALAFLLATCWFLLIFQSLIFFIKSQNKKYIFYLFGIYLLALFTSEYALFFPLLLMVYCLVYLTNTHDKITFVQIEKSVFIPMFFLVLTYFCLNKLIIGTWIGHYGAKTHLNFDILIIGANCIKFFLKQVFYLRYIAEGSKQAIFTFCSNPWVVFSTMVFFFGLCYLALRKQSNIFFRLMMLLLTMFLLTIAPISNLFFYYFNYIETDRYNYFPSVFSSVLIAVAIFFLPQTLRTAGACLYIFVGGYLTYQTNIYWEESAKVYHSLIKNFDWNDKDTIIVLNIPDNYYGANMFRKSDKYDSSLQYALEYQSGKPFNGKVYDVLSYNMVAPNNGCEVRIDNDSCLTIAVSQWGTWFWNNGIGASNYSNDLYKVEMGDFYYYFTLKRPVSEKTVFLLQKGDCWEEVIWQK